MQVRPDTLRRSPPDSAPSLRRIRAPSQVGCAGTVDAVATVAVAVLRAHLSGAAVAASRRWGRATGVLFAGPAVVTRDQLALVRVGARAARAAARARGAGVAVGARPGRARAARLTACVRAAVVGRLRASGRRRWRIVAAARLAKRTSRHDTDACPNRVAVAVGGAQEAAALARAHRRREGACGRPGPAGLGGAALRGSYGPTLVGCPACLGRRRAACARACVHPRGAPASARAAVSSVSASARRGRAAATFLARAAPNSRYSPRAARTSA